MSVYGISDVVEESNYYATEGNRTRKKTILSLDDITHSVLYTYALVIKKRMRAGDPYRGLSRREYQDNKLDEFPNYWDIVRAVGSWSEVNKLLPYVSDEVKHSKRKRIVDATPRHLYSILEKIAGEENIPLDKVRIAMFDEYRRNHPEKNIPNWKTFAKASPRGVDNWRDVRRHAIETAWLDSD